MFLISFGNIGREELRKISGICTVKIGEPLILCRVDTKTWKEKSEVFRSWPGRHCYHRNQPRYIYGGKDWKRYSRLSFVDNLRNTHVQRLTIIRLVGQERKSKHRAYSIQKCWTRIRKLHCCSIWSDYWWQEHHIEKKSILRANKKLDQSGACIADSAIDLTTAPHALDPESAKKLWALSEKLVGQEFSYN